MPDETPGVPEMPDLGGLLDSFQKVQQARTQTYEGRAGGGAVVVRASGELEFESVTISADVVDPGVPAVRRRAWHPRLSRA